MESDSEDETTKLNQIRRRPDWILHILKDDRWAAALLEDSEEPWDEDKTIPEVVQYVLHCS
jgi:hypothetical protein